MKVKNKYLLTYDTIELRRASLDDNMEEIASLIYDTDAYIYPFWFDKNKEEVIEFLKKSTC